MYSFHQPFPPTGFSNYQYFTVTSRYRACPESSFVLSDVMTCTVSEINLHASFGSTSFFYEDILFLLSDYYSENGWSSARAVVVFLSLVVARSIIRIRVLGVRRQGAAGSPGQL